jgi:hypothetical protein
MVRISNVFAWCRSLVNIDSTTGDQGARNDDITNFKWLLIFPALLVSELNIGQRLLTHKVAFYMMLSSCKKDEA